MLQALGAEARRCGSSSAVERLVANEKVAGAIPVSRSIYSPKLDKKPLSMQVLSINEKDIFAANSLSYDSPHNIFEYRLPLLFLL